MYHGIFLPGNINWNPYREIFTSRNFLISTANLSLAKIYLKIHQFSQILQKVQLIKFVFLSTGKSFTMNCFRRDRIICSGFLVCVKQDRMNVYSEELTERIFPASARKDLFSNRVADFGSNFKDRERRLSFIFEDPDGLKSLLRIAKFEKK